MGPPGRGHGPDHERQPGFGGQAFLPASLAKIELLRSQIRRAKLDVDIQVDGGIKAENIGEVAAAGANVIVSGRGSSGRRTTRRRSGA
jgi:ribulose-phosphate 3-epimerase